MVNFDSAWPRSLDRGALARQMTQEFIKEASKVGCQAVLAWHAAKEPALLHSFRFHAAYALVVRVIN
jgi:hypothetical protein